jgi:hypothetical protein
VTFEVTMDKRPCLVCYDYGTGGLWAVVCRRAPEEEIHRDYPELLIAPERPKSSAVGAPRLSSCAAD